jgi:hypothetical protein
MSVPIWPRLFIERGVVQQSYLLIPPMSKWLCSNERCLISASSKVEANNGPFLATPSQFIMASPWQSHLCHHHKWLCLLKDARPGIASRDNARPRCPHSRVLCPLRSFLPALLGRTFSLVATNRYSINEWLCP